jgi:hypothetical protein
MQTNEFTDVTLTEEMDEEPNFVSASTSRHNSGIDECTIDRSATTPLFSDVNINIVYL